MKIGLNDFLEKKPDAINFFSLNNEKTVCFNTYLDRPFEGSSSIITEGVSLLRSDNKKRTEFVMSFTPYSVEMDRELRSLLATYLDFYFCKVDHLVSYGDFFIVNDFKLINNFEYIGFYTLHPAYFPENMPEEYIWLLPIFKSEYNYLCEHGSESFLDLIEKEDPDLTQLNRSEII